ncbi:MAG: radical SAM protein [SAR324 cluster bacterium]|nr:radical SAM protein [SAR324 cluster bacterium]
MRKPEIEKLFEAYPSVPIEAILKQDILRLGVSFTVDSLKIAAGFKPKDYFIFSFDLVTLEDMEKDQSHLFKAPEEVKLFGGIWDLAPTIFNVRLNPASPYLIKLADGKLVLELEGEAVCQAEYHPMPAYYAHPLASGKKISEIAPTLEWGYLIYLTLYRLCQYWGKEEECQFCDINENYRQQKKAGRDYTGVKKIEDILDALSHIEKYDTTSKAITLTGGAITGNLNGKNEVDFYLDYAAAIYEKFGRRWIIKAVVEAFEKDECKRLHAGGVQIYHPNYEIWNKDLFQKLCPGKERFVGYQEWMNRIVDSAEIFGPENVIPNFVGGVEMSAPYGFTDLHEAVDSTALGLEFFMSKGILPRFTTWCAEPLAHLGPQQAPPLEYYVKLLAVYKETKERHNLPNPPGYGEAGRGKAVFSVSAFMDVL